MFGRLLLRIAFLVSLPSIVTSAASWPAHGIYQVIRDDDSTLPLCELHGFFDDGSSLRVFDLKKFDNGSLMVIVGGDNSTFKPTNRVLVSLDGHRVFDFEPDQTFADGDGIKVVMLGWAAAGSSGPKLINHMQAAARTAHWLDIHTLPQVQELPANGLADALADLNKCHSGKFKPKLPASGLMG